MRVKAVSHSKLNTYQECEAKFRHQYIRKIGSRKRPIYFVFGEAAHKFLEVYYRTRGDWEQGMKEALAVFDAVDKGPLTPDEINTLVIERAKVEGICQAYPLFYKQDFQEFKTILTELSFRKDKGFKLAEHHGKPIYYEGDIDALVEDAAGDWWIMEHKFLAPQTLTQAFIDKIHIDSQVLGYMHLAKECAIGEWPKGVIYNVIKKPAIRLKKGETKQAFATRVKNEYIVHGEKKEYFIRHEPQISHTHLKTWREEKAHLAGMIYTRMGIKSKCWPKNTGACTNNYGSCLYLPACVTRHYNRLLYEKIKKRESESSTQETKKSKEGKKEGKKRSKSKKSA